MIKEFTQEQIIAYIYGDASAEQARQIEAALESNVRLRRFCEQMIKMKNKISKVEKQPSCSTINNILIYSRLKSTEPAE